ncbi:hypothetical protein AB0I87_33525 [Streptomyces sp. NPDC049952]|uniref:hypothetical protein n=1 Tax=Streptomyces sp. NPDC049952 TaxID=3156665 RepID=UPI00343AA53E
MTDDAAPPPGRTPRRGPARKQMLLRLDPAVHDALARWASDELRSANAQIEFLLRRASQRRIPKTSAHWYSDVIRRHALPPVGTV